jgi:hypothetical protein
MITKNIKSVGVELEGGIDSYDFEKLIDFVKKNNLNKHFSYGSDGSVYVRDKDYHDIEIKFWHNDLNIFLNFIEYVFVHCGFEQNSSCGNHMHFKFVNNSRAKSIFSFGEAWKIFKQEYIKFVNTLEENLREKYLKRLENKYCRFEYIVDIVIKQLNSYDKNYSRYYAINLSSYNLHKTLEIRLLPHFSDYEEAKKAILWLINTIDAIYSNVKINYVEEIKIDSEENNFFEEKYVVKIEKLKDIKVKVKTLKI